MADAQESGAEEAGGEDGRPAVARSPGRHRGRVVIVTGAASGIGRATVEKIAAEDGAVVAADLEEADMSWLGSLDRVVPIRLDVTDEAANHRMVEVAIAEFGRLDGLALNAGISASGPLLELDMATFDRAMEVNVRALLLGIRAAAPALIETGGAVAITASTSGIGADPGMWPYNTSKGAAIQVARATALDLGPSGVRVNAVCPGPTETGMTAAIKSRDEIYEGLRARIPLQRWAAASELANVISFVLSDEASFVTGAIIPVDGGITANTGQFMPGSR